VGGAWCIGSSALKAVWKTVMPIMVRMQAAVTQAQFGDGWGRKIEVAAAKKVV
jgi:hypothetical protein